MSKRARLIYNPAARAAPKEATLREALAALRGWEAELETTAGPEHATELAREAGRRGYDAVIACGGDGTVNEAANGLAGSETALAVVRGGTANVWAKEAHLPRDPAQAVRLVDHGELRAIDLGRAGERYFLLLAGIGPDAQAIRSVSSTWKRRLGAAAFVLQGLRTVLRLRAQPGDLDVDGADLSGPFYWALLSNTRSYGGVLSIARRARVNDGLLDLYLLREGGLRRVLWLTLLVLLRRHERHRNVVYRTARSFDLRTAGLPVHVDGEYIGETPLRFEVAPGALRVVVPPRLRSALFR